MEDIIIEEKLTEIDECSGYYISNYGNVYSIKQGYLRKLKPYIDSKGIYMLIRIIDNEGKRKGYLVHRLVAIHFLDNPYNLLEVNHKDNNPKNNHVSNLEWCTRKENLLQSYRTMSPKRNCNNCILYKNEEPIGSFESIEAASKFGYENLHLSYYSLVKNLQCGQYKIIETRHTRKNISDSKKHKQYNINKV